MTRKKHRARNGDDHFRAKCTRCGAYMRGHLCTSTPCAERRDAYEERHSVGEAFDDERSPYRDEAPCPQ